MFELNDALKKFALDSENPELNYNLGLIYESIGQTAAAISFYLRASERTTIVEHSYECLLRVGNCFNKQGNRKNTVQKTYKQALTLLPNRPEAYLCLAKFFEINDGNSDSYIFADLGLKVANFELPPLRTNVCEPLTDVYSGLLLEKAICSWGWGKNQETRDLFSLIYNEHYDKFNDAYKTIIRNNMTKMKLLKNKIIDYFPFFAPYGEELLELRISVLKDHVDYFIISESNKTHAGVPTERKFLEISRKLNLPIEKIIYLPLDIPDDDDLIVEEIDILNTYILDSYQNYTWTPDSEKIENRRARARERLQKDAILHVLDKFDDDDVIIHSDSDEIIDPKHIPYLAKCCREYRDKIIKIPLMLCEAQADLRVYWKNSNNPVDWSGGMFFATVEQLKKSTPTQIRSNNLNPYSITYITENNQIVQDLGWHFSWMGGARERQIKVSNFTHYNDKFFWMKDTFESYADNKFLKWSNETEFKDGSISPSGNPNFILKRISHGLLPKELFNNERLKSYFLKEDSVFYSINKKSKNTLWIVDNIYENPDEIRKFALDQEYVEGGFGRGFIGRRTVKSFLFDGLKEKFEQIIGKSITGWTAEDNPEKYGMNGRFQIAWAGEPLVYHCDNQRWGGMLYLTPDAPYQCGTTLYAHKQTRARTYYDSGWDAAWNHPGGSHLDRTPWEPVDVAGNVYNRLVIFDASAIHSASEYFGNSKENARLWQMFFFDTD
jgi:tetratricopeptide (TPR) repeat protein